MSRCAILYHSSGKTIGLASRGLRCEEIVICTIQACDLLGSEKRASLQVFTSLEIAFFKICLQGTCGNARRQSGWKLFRHKFHCVKERSRLAETNWLFPRQAIDVTESLWLDNCISDLHSGQAKTSTTPSSDGFPPPVASRCPSGENVMQCILA